MNAMRIGTTSYIIPADMLTNVRALAGHVCDIELVIFELDDRWGGLPDAEAVREMVSIASDHEMTYTIHLPLDLALAADDNEHSVGRASRVIDATRGLSPVGYIVHLEQEPAALPDDERRWLENSLRSLEALIPYVDHAGEICVENLESHTPEMIDAVLGSMEVSSCVDVGHLWRRDLEPTPHVTKWLPRAKVVHLHGVEGKDHQSLSLMPPQKLDPVVALLDQNFGGVLTLEVFSERDLATSRDALEQSLKRVRGS